MYAKGVRFQEMNWTRTLRAPQRRQALRITLFALACLAAVAGSTLRPAAQAAKAFGAPAQEVTKRRVAKRSAPQADAQQPQTAKPAKGAKLDASALAPDTITPLSTSCANKPT